jgi:hypothetical protein
LSGTEGGRHGHEDRRSLSDVQHQQPDLLQQAGIIRGQGQRVLAAQAAGGREPAVKADRSDHTLDNGNESGSVKKLLRLNARRVAVIYIMA